MKNLLLLVFSVVVCGRVMVASQHDSMPPGMTHEEHLAQIKRLADVKARGNTSMGFDQDKTTHHFRLTVYAGMIEVAVNDSADTENLGLIRSHLQEIAEEFQRGNFDKPFATHNEIPPGVPQMQQLRSSINYRFSKTARGAVVRIRTSNKAAIEAIHEFLRYQIREHATGDPVTVGK